MFPSLVLVLYLILESLLRPGRVPRSTRYVLCHPIGRLLGSGQVTAKKAKHLSLATFFVSAFGFEEFVWVVVVKLSHLCSHISLCSHTSLYRSVCSFVISFLLAGDEKQIGVFEIAKDKIYQIRGFDLSVMTAVRTETGWLVIDPLISGETAAAALVRKTLTYFTLKLKIP